MLKLSLVICAVLLVSVACAQRAESAPDKDLKEARAACVESINLAISRISEKYDSAVDQLPNRPSEAMTELFTRATDILKSLIPRVEKVHRFEEGDKVETAFGDVVHCYKDLAKYVRDIANRVFYDRDFNRV